VALSAVLCLTPVSARAQGAQHFAADPVYFDYPAGWTVTRDQSNPALQGYIIAQAQGGPQITLLFAPGEITAGAGELPTLLEAARTSVLLPLIEQLLQPLVAVGAQVQRARAQTELGGTTVTGDRWLVSAAGDAGTLDGYLLALNRHLVIVIFIQPARSDARAAAAWDLFRRTLSVGAPAANVETAPAAPPSTAALNDATALLTQLTDLTKQAAKLRADGNYTAGVTVAERALAVAEQVEQLPLPADFKASVVPGALNLLGDLYRGAGRYDRAEATFARALKLYEQTKGADDPALAAPLNNLGVLYYETGAYTKALPVFQRAYDLSVKNKGAEHPDTATALNNLAQIYDDLNDFARAEELMRRALAIREKALGAEHPDVAVSLSNLGTLYDELGDPARAEQAMRRALAIKEKAQGPDHPETATVLNNLGLLFKHNGDLVQSEAYFNRSLAVVEKAQGPDSAALAPTLDNLATLFMERSDYARAEQLFKRALDIRQRALGPEHPDVAETLNNLALLYMERTDYAQAGPLLERARRIFENKFGPEHKLTATALDNLGGFYLAQKDYARAEPLFLRAQAVRAKLFGPESIEAAVSVNNLGALASARGDSARAIELFGRALRAYEKTYGPEHPTLSTYLANLSTDYYASGDLTRARETMARALELSERRLAQVLTTGSEEQKRLFVASIAEGQDYAVSLHAQGAPNDPQALRLALLTVLRRKGRVLDAMSDQIGSLRRHLGPADRALLEQLATKNAELAALVLKGPGALPPEEYQARLAKLNAAVNDLQAQISTRSAEFRAAGRPVTLEAVQQAIPAGAALVEFAQYRPYDTRGRTRAERFGAAHYLAYVTRNTGQPAWVELGEAAPIDDALAAWRVALADPRRADVKELGRALDERLMRPVRQLLGETRQLFLSPDGALNLIPFGALVDEQGKYLVESYTITYLTSGRDLLRLGARAESRQPAVVVADPSFDAGMGAAGVQTGQSTTAQTGATQTGAAAQRGGGAGRRSVDFAAAHFSPLPGTAAEGRALGALMPGLKLLTGAQATEAALKQLSGPQVLHVATHGFFLPGTARASAGGTRGLALGGGDAPLPGENPLLRSGLALAGANVRQSAGGEDGVLTALEASGLDLWGTKLVVLSACETGLGDVRGGEGVYGLRRALVLAGSESQVMSLWQVSDAATRDLMVAYYRRLQAGEGRTEALRQVQLEMIRGGAQSAGAGGQRGLMGDAGARPQAEERGHPFYWASFIQSGAWGGMSAKP
jgi:CHAT domain-containing protein/Tfp pilus assembly protein PilF